MKIDRSKLPFYICGPMTGIPQFNYPLFERAASMVRQVSARGAISPAEMDSAIMREHALASPDGNLEAIEQASNETWGDVLARDVKLIEQQVGGFVLLPGWQKSRGARLEVFVGLLVGITDYCEFRPSWLFSGLNPAYVFERAGVDYIREQLKENMP